MHQDSAGNPSFSVEPYFIEDSDSNSSHDWPQHIDDLIRTLGWCRLVELLQGDEDESQRTQRSDELAADLCWLIAVHPESSPHALHLLAQHDSYALLERVAENPKTHSYTLSMLAEHPDARVRIAVAENASCPAHIFAKLINDEHDDVRYSIAENHQIDAEWLTKLIEDENCFVAARARQTLSRILPGATKTLNTSQNASTANEGQGSDRKVRRVS